MVKSSVSESDDISCDVSKSGDHSEYDIDSIRLIRLVDALYQLTLMKLHMKVSSCQRTHFVQTEATSEYTLAMSAKDSYSRDETCYGRSTIVRECGVVCVCVCVCVRGTTSIYR